MIILLKWSGLIFHSLISDNIQFFTLLRRGTCVQCSINRLNIEHKWKRVSIKTEILCLPFFFCQRDCSQRAMISKQQAYGTSYCWQIPYRRLKGKQAEESKRLLPLCSSFWYEIWPSFWYDGGKMLLFLNFVIFSPIT